MDCKCQCYLDSHQPRKRSSNFGNGAYRDAKFRQCSSLAGLQLYDIDLGNWHHINSHAEWHRDSFQQFPVRLFPLEQFDLVPPAYWYLDRFYHYGERRGQNFNYTSVHCAYGHWCYGSQYQYDLHINRVAYFTNREHDIISCSNTQRDFHRLR
ncbi:hypothetical protein LY76DRAFT_608730 [Colletotrichum caudatum]|nr:hypothetical protein LY76DRAFT_608730 [Colletotrichum caudatum]